MSSELLWSGQSLHWNRKAAYPFLGEGLTWLELAGCHGQKHELHLNCHASKKKMAGEIL